MKIVTCYKWVLDDADIRVNESTRELDLEKSKAQINDYDQIGLEVGVQLKAATGADLVGISCGVNCAVSSKDALARGMDAVYTLDHSDLAGADSAATSKTLAAMIKHLDTVDIVICSEGSSDEYAQQVGPRIAALLGFNCITYASRVQMQGDVLKVERKLDDGVEVIEVNTPVVISIAPDIGEAPIPGVKQILGAKKKPSTALTLEDIGISADTLKPQLVVSSVKAPVVSRKAQRMNPEGVDISVAASDLVKQLRVDGVL
ncbi:MAG: electron transfer flavoprotein subunit beta/FixA family protein [Enterobacteriaceae bacterium]|jgi:electron transfer flavoprotein beta subunit|nr:electron transfer flavoprotein subunit beta/FixA family protein [Enterobacteriaceae bacterium]